MTQQSTAIRTVTVTAPPPAPKQAKLRLLPGSGAIQAQSSDGHTIYDVTIGEHPSCTCPAGANGRICYHVIQAGERYAAMWPIPAGLRLPANVVRFPVAAAQPEPTPPAAPKRRALVSDLYGPEVA